MEDRAISRDVRGYYCDYCGICRSKKSYIASHILSHHKQLPPLHPSAAGSSTAPISPPALNHPPPYAEMIYAAITTLQEKGGSSKIAIGKHIEQTYSNLPANHLTLLTEQLHQLKNTGHLRMVKKSYKLPGPKTSRGCEPNAAVPKSRSPVGRPRKQLPPLHPSAVASPAAPIAPPALDHPPPYTEMIYAAITTLKEKGGSSKIAIGKHIEQTYSNLPANHSTLLSEHLHQLKNTGHLRMVKKSYKLPGPKTSRGCEPNAAVPKSRRPVGRPRKQLPPLHPSAAASSPIAPPALNHPPPYAEDEVVHQSHQVLQEHALTAELQQVRDDRDRLTAELQQVRDDRDRSTAELTAAKEKLKMYECQLLEAETLRRKMHNNIMDLKGCIRVFCRVRPLLPQDGARQEESLISYSTSTEFRGRRIFVFHEGKKNQFTFDKVLSPVASQQDVFVEVLELVQSVMDGYKVCIIAYGQAGSGKTYTMLGRPEASEKGLIPRSLEQIFQISRSLLAKGWNYKMQASMLEIYNGAIYDLLDQSTGSARKQGLQLHLDANEDHYVGDLTVADVGSIGEIFSLLQQATQARSVGKTEMNEQSSRSHLVFKLEISGVNEGTKQQVQGVLNFVDLAGSERLSDNSRVVGDRLREIQEINLSLTSLSKVILALVKKEVHVPFRNSVLTRILQPYLGKDSKTLMVVNISPNPSSVGESMCSLRFAANANACETGFVRPQPSAVRRGVQP